VYEKETIPFVPFDQRELAKMPPEDQATLEYTLGDPDKETWKEIYKFFYIKHKGRNKDLVRRLLLKDIAQFKKEHWGRALLKSLTPRIIQNLDKKKILRLREREILPLTRGVPQGFGLSPMLSCFALYKLMEKWKDHLVMYMDDGLLISNNFIDIKEFEQDVIKLGINIAHHKSGMIKTDGK